jgi:hypothetical protein
MAKRIYVPTLGPQEWQRLLADPAKQWKAGYSARALAICWEAANGWPPEINALFASSGMPELGFVEPLLAIPEYKVDLPPRGRASQNDLFVLGKAVDGQLIAMTVEGKVGESFGPTLGEWRVAASAAKIERLLFLTRELGLPTELPPTIRYQLLHRTASALLLARKFNAHHAAMVIHSFSRTGAGLEDFAAFTELFGGQRSTPDSLLALRHSGSINLYAGWASGDPRFLEG